MIRKTQVLFAILILTFPCSVICQNTIKGVVTDAAYNDAIIGANVIIEGTSEGTITDWDGSFEFTTDKPYPFNVVFSYIGYGDKIVTIEDDKRVNVVLTESSSVIEEVVVKGSRISDKQKESPLTIEALDIIAIKETPAANFYDGLGALKGIDLTAASLGFKVINTRGFNSTSPVRSLQIIDGVDNQAPGLNFSLGNFLGSSELDVNKVEIIVGASSAFYGPNAFNGVISMETKDPFFHEGLSASIKGGERNLLQGAVRWAQAIKNKDGNKAFAYKINAEVLRADDWVAENFDPVFDTETGVDNPGGYDAVNIYGDEYQSSNDFSSVSLSDARIGTIRTWHRTGYEEIDLVDYNTRNYKAAGAFHFRTKPDLQEQSPELIFGANFGSGTTVYQGDNRFSLKGITFLQNKLEYRKKNKFFIRAYTTRTSAGDSYDPYFTALQLQENAKVNREWSIDYASFWQNGTGDISSPFSQIVDLGYPVPEVIFDPVTGQVVVNFDVEGAQQFFVDNSELFDQWHQQAADYANGPGYNGSNAKEFYAPGTTRFDEEFSRITSTLRSDSTSGTKFFDNSSLYHVHGEYKFTPTWMNEITVGANYRLYAPESNGTVFSDGNGEKIKNSEVGFYTGLQKSFADNKLKASVAVRGDKNQNFNFLVSPAASLVYTPSANNFFRISFSSAIRNPTLSDQYLNLNVGRAILSGNIDGVQDLVTVESLLDYFAQNNLAALDSFDIAPVEPEKVKTFEAGFRTTLFEKLFVDAGYYYSIYDNFLGFNIGVDFDYTLVNNLVSINRIQPFRYSANSKNRVTTQGFSIGLNYYLDSNFTINGNYSWNKLNKDIADDPIIPAFNTPEHKYNLGFAGRNLEIGSVRNFSFNINYKWIEGFLFEGSPQFTGLVPTYDMLDAQISFGLQKINSVLKIGASNILDNKQFQTYGGPRIGRLGYISWTYDLKK